MIKRLLFSLTLFTSATALYAQIPNSAFESWTKQPNSNYYNPNSWATANILVPLGNPVSAFKDSVAPHVAGGYASMRLETVKLTSNPFAPDLPDTLGIAFTGSINVFTGQLISGFAYAARPSSLSFYCKYTPSGADTAIATVALHRWNTTTNQRDTIATGLWWTASNITSYTNQILPLTYDAAHSTTYPDTAVIIFSSSSYHAPQIGSTLWLDDLGWLGWTGIDAMGIPGEGVYPYPNPASDIINFTVNVPGAASMQVFDLTGRMVESITVRGQNIELPVTAYSPAVYMYTIVNNAGELLWRGKFTVSR